ncbi:MAG TPA: glycoside hydrolase family 13 protein [Gaiellaceae bacterium]
MTSTAGVGAATLLADPHHDGSELYVVEAPDEPGEEAVVRLRVPREAAAEQVFLRYGRDGQQLTVEAVRDEDSADETWWLARFRAWNPTTRYRWLLTGGEIGYAWLNGVGLGAHEPPVADDFVLALGPPGPDWHLESVVYEIFPDRFASSGAARELPDWAVPRPWDALPTGHGPDTPFELFGGDLAGIEQRLDYIEALGANALYLTPFFPAGSAHRYDATTFEHVDPLLGGDEALASLIRGAHARGIRVLGDLTLNHTGSGHEWFRAARDDPASPERGFYFFDDALAHGYAAWMGIRTLPKLDWRSEELRRRMAEVLGRFGLDGWRIDVANMTGRYRDVDLNADVARWARARGGDRLLVAEHGHDFRGDLDGLGWHGVMNYAGFNRPVLWWLRGDAYEEDDYSQTPAPRHNGATAVAMMRRFRAGVPWGATLHSWTLLDSHDTPRFGTIAESRERQVVGIGLQMTTPGVPMVFAGAELGLEGAWGEDARRTMPWDRPETWDTDLLETYRRLIALRRSSDALARGGIRYLLADDDAIVYLRETRSERVLCAAKRAAHPFRPAGASELEHLFSTGTDAGPSFNVWRLHDG